MSMSDPASDTTHIVYQGKHYVLPGKLEAQDALTRVKNLTGTGPKMSAGAPGTEGFEDTSKDAQAVLDKYPEPNRARDVLPKLAAFAATGAAGAYGATASPLGALPKSAQLLIKSVLKFEAAKHGTRAVLETAGVPSPAASLAGEMVGTAAGGVGMAGTLRELLAARSAAPVATAALRAAVPRAVPAAAPAIAQAAAPAAEAVAAQAVPAVAEAAAPKAAQGLDAMASEIASKIAKLRTAHGMSEGQIAQSIQELYGINRSSATTMTRMVLQSAPKAAEPVAAAAGNPVMAFAKQAAKSTKLGEKIWMELDAAGQPLRTLTSDQAAAAARAGRSTTWVKNIWR